MAEPCKLLTNGLRINWNTELGADTDSLEIFKFHHCCFEGKTYSHSEFMNSFESGKFFGGTPLRECAMCTPNSISYIADRVGSAPPGKIAKLEIVLTDTCNASCIMCGPWSSSLWKKEVFKYFRDITPDPVKHDFSKHIKNLPTLPGMDFSELRFVLILGGELFATPEILAQFLNMILDEANIPPVIGIITNGSIIPSDDMIQLLKKFGGVEFILSLDGVGDRFEYIRYPLSWEKVSNNVLTLAKISAEHNFQIGINHTVTPLNILYINEIWNWASAEKLNLNFLRANIGGGTLGLEYMSSQFKADWLKKYSTHQWLDSNMALGCFFARTNVDQTPSSLSSFVAYLDSWDTRRGLSWRKTFPEIVKYFE